MKIRRTISLLTALLVSGTTLTGCGLVGSDDGSKAEVIWYTGINPEQNAAVIKAFNEIHPDIEVKALRRTSSELAIRFAQERESGAKSADVLANSDPGFIEEGFEQGWWDTELEKPADWPEAEWNKGVAKVGIVPIAIGYNSDRVTGDDIPSAWEDVLDKSLKGNLLFSDPRNQVAYLSLMQIWADEYGIEFLEKVAAQDFQLVESIVPGNQSLAAGAGRVLVPDARPAAATTKSKGGPVEIVDMSPTTGVETFGAVSNKAQDPEAARLFYEFLLTEEGQSHLNGDTAASVLGQVGDTSKLPDGYIPLTEVLPRANANRKQLLSALGLN